MQQVKTKNRLSLIFSFYFFSFFLIFLIVFYIFIRLVFYNQIRNELIHEIGEITPTHIFIDNQKQLQFKKDEKNETLRQHLFRDGISAIFFDKQRGLIRRYGLFELPQENENLPIDIVNLIDDCQSKKKVSEQTITWHNEQLISFITPLLSNGKIIGFMLLAKPLVIIDNITNTILNILIGLGLIGLAGSYLLTYFLVNQSFSPIKKIAGVIDKIDLNRLEKKVNFTGHPDDELVILSNKINEMIVRLKEMSTKQREFIANASHELKTPLARAISSLDVNLALKKFDATELKLIKNDIMEINNLIEKLLHISRLSRDFYPLKGITYLNNLVEKLAKEFGRFTYNIPANFTIQIPIEYLEIILRNLLSNAIKFTPLGKKISLRAFVEKKIKIIQLEDEGVGINKEELSKIFDRYYRVEENSKFIQGNGIGLSLVKQLCDIYNVKISVESTKDKGTKFVLVF